MVPRFARDQLSWCSWKVYQPIYFKWKPCCIKIRIQYMDTKLLCNRVIIHQVHFYIVHCSFASNVLYANACSQELVNLHILFDLDSNIDKIIDWILQNMNNYAQVRIALWKGKNVLTDLAHPVHVIEFVSTSKQRCFPSGKV